MNELQQSMMISPTVQAQRDEVSRSMIQAEINKDPSNPDLRKEMSLRFKDTQPPAQRPFADLKSALQSPKFTTLSPEAKKVVFDKYSVGDKAYEGLSEEAKKVVQDKYLSTTTKPAVQPKQDLLHNVVGSAATLADQAAGLVVGGAQAAGQAAQYVYGKVVGDKEAAQKAVASVAPLDNLYGGYSKLIDSAFGEGTSSGSTVGHFFGKVGEKIQEGQNLYSKGNVEKQAEAKVVTDFALNYMLPHVVGIAGKAISKAKGPVSSTPSTKPKIDVGDLRAKLSEVAPDLPPAQVSATIRNVRSSLSEIDTRINAEAKAHDLMSRGASKREVEGVIKRNPEVGTVMEEIRTRRADQALAMKDTVQGEILPPSVIKVEPTVTPKLEESVKPPTVDPKLLGDIEHIEAAPAPPDLPPNPAAPKDATLKDGSPVVYYHDTMPDHYKVTAIDPTTGTKLGETSFYKHKTKDGAYEGLVKTEEAHQRKGVATGMYDYAKKDMGLDVKPSGTQTDAGRAFSSKYHEEPTPTDGVNNTGSFGQGGEVDPRLLATIGLTGGGAAIGAAVSDDKLEGGVLGGILGLIGPKIAESVLLKKTPVKDSIVGKFMGELGKGSDKAFGFLMTRLENQSPLLAKEALAVESKIQVDSYTAISVADDFFTFTDKHMKPLAPEIKNLWLNGDRATLLRALESTGNVKAIESFKNLVKTVDVLGKELSDRGIIKGVTEGYLPRMVKDRAGLLKALNLPAREALEKTVHEATVKAGRPLDDLEFSEIVNKYMVRRVPAGSAKPGFSKARVFEEVPKEIQPFYFGPVETYHSYAYKAVNEIHTADFFGKSKALRDGKIDIENSIGNKVMDLLKTKAITLDQVSAVQDILETRYKFGNQVANKYIQEYKNWTTGILLADISSSFQNLGDLVMAPFIYGMKPALGAITQKLTGKSALTVEDFGLVNHISEEFVSTSKSKIYVDKVMKMAGWKILDPIGKEVALNASVLRAQNWAKSERGLVQLKQRYGEAWGKDFPDLVKDLQDGTLSKNVQLMSFWDVSRHQPLTRLQKTELATKNPNLGGLVYQFKSFMLAQANLVRVEAYNNIKAGGARRTRGLYMLASLGAGYALSGASNNQIQNFILGRDEEFKGVDLFWNTMKTFGLNEYTYKKAAQGDIKGVLSSVALPPTALLTGWTKKDAEGQAVLDKYNIMRKVPIVGKEVAERTLKEDKNSNTATR